jgi:ribosomal protein S18 acetylase RimI-like enzyme
MRIRRGGDGDAAAVVGLWSEAYVGDGPGERSEPYRLPDYEAAAAAGCVFVAEEDRGGCGAVVLYPPGTPDRDVPRSGEAELSRLAVSREARGRGVGRALARRCVAAAATAGAEAIVLWTRPHQVEAHRLYESLGFARAEERDAEDAGGPRLVYRLDLGARN